MKIFAGFVRYHCDVDSLSAVNNRFFNTTLIINRDGVYLLRSFNRKMSESIIFIVNYLHFRTCKDWKTLPEKDSNRSAAQYHKKTTQNQSL
jgi:hypothetical protein